MTSPASASSTQKIIPASGATPAAASLDTTNVSAIQTPATKELSQVEKDIAQKQKRLEELNNQFTQLTTKNKTIRDEISRIETDQAKNEQALAVLKEKINSVEKEKTSNKARMKDISATMKRLRDEHTNLGNAQKVLSKTRRGLETEEELLKTQQGTLATRLKAQQEELEKNSTEQTINRTEERELNPPGLGWRLMGY